MANIQSAKVSVILDQPFFGALLCHLKFAADPTCETAWTDGTTLGYNPQYVDSLSHSELVGLLAHEVLHCAAGHPYRRDAREGKKWNIAADLAINGLIAEAGMSLPPGALMPDTNEKGKSAEWIYARLPDSPEDNGSGSGQGQAPGEVRDSPQGTGQPKEDGQDGQGDSFGTGQGDSQEQPNTESDWKEKVRQAAQQAKMRGDKSGAMGRFADGVTESKVDWKDVLRRFVQQACKADYSWSKPSARWASSDIFMPAMKSESMPRVAIGVDTSGSMDDTALTRAKSEVQAVIDEVSPDGVDIFYADARVCGHDSFDRGEQLVFRPKGGGGTDFRPVFQAAEDLEEKPACLIYITDLYGSFPDNDHGIPTLWVTDQKQVAPFGETIQIQY